MKPFAPAIALMAFLAVHSVPTFGAQNATNTTSAKYDNLAAAVAGQNLTGLASLLNLTGLSTTLSNPNLTVTLFAPTNLAIEAVTSELTAANVNITDVLPVILLYHVVNQSNITLTDDSILPTLLASRNLTNTTSTLTLLQLSKTSWYLGGIISGAAFNVSSRVRAGKSDMYIIDMVLVPPSYKFNVSTTVYGLLQSNSSFSILSALVGNDTLVKNYTSNPNLAATIFAPTDAAFKALLAANNLTLSQIVNTTTARAILLNHVLPHSPITSDDVPFNASRITTLLNDTIIVNKTALNRTRFNITVRGGGNAAAIPVLILDFPAAMSAVHVIGGVILPSANATSNSTTPPAPPSANSTTNSTTNTTSGRSFY